MRFKAVFRRHPFMTLVVIADAVLQRIVFGWQSTGHLINFSGARRHS